MATVNNSRQNRINQEKRKKRAGGIVIIIIAIFLLFSISHGLFRMVKDGITRSLLDYQPAVAGEVEFGVRVNGFFFRPEVVFKAPVAGRFENTVLNEARVRQGTVIGQLYPANGGAPRTVQAPTTGMVVFGVDGLESALAEFEFMSCTPQILDYQANFRLLAGEEITSGQPLLKIVDNLAPLQVVIGFKLAAFTEPWESGKKIDINHEGKSYRAEVTALKGSGGTGMAFLTIPSNDHIGRLRTAAFTVVEARAQGVTIPVLSLVQHESGVGVYALENGAPTLLPVTITCRNQERAVVEGIEIGDLVLTNPERIRGAQPLVAR